MPILSLIEKEEGPTLVTLCNNQNFTFYFKLISQFSLKR